MLSEGELHVQAMRLTCEALEDREENGLGVDWRVLQQQLDQMDAILQSMDQKHRYDSSEIVDLRRERDAARAENETLRQQLSADAVRQELEELKAKNTALLERLATVENAAATENETLRGAMAADDKRLRDAEERVWPGETRGCDAPDAMADEILGLRQQLAAARAETVDARRRLNEEINRHNATNAEKIIMFEHKESANQHAAELVKERDAALAAVSLQRAGIELQQRAVHVLKGKVDLLQRFAEKIRMAHHCDNWPSIGVALDILDGVEFDDLSRALGELDAETSKPEDGQ